MAPRLLIVGWDSATFDLVDPMIEAGRLPVLACLQERGSRAPLRSVWPPMTDCAWTCAFTGRNAGAHGIFGSWYRAPGAYECRYFSSRDRQAPALWELTDGIRHLVWNVPMTFPPTSVQGVMVSGYGAPPGARIAEPSALQDELSQRWALGDLLDVAPHSSLEAFRADLLRGLEAQAEALPWAIERTEADVVEIVWPHIDRAQHFFWKFRGTDHALSGAIEETYEAMDAATGALVEAFPDADVMVVSDHGAGELKGDINLGAWLTSNGWAVPGSSNRSGLAELAWALPPSVRRLGRRLSPSLARKAMGARLTGQLGSFDWSRTKAFMGFHSDLWLNLKGRELQGIVDPGDADRVLDEISAGLLEIRDPATNEPVIAAVHRKEEVFSGPALDLAPDLICDPWAAGYRVAPARDPHGDVIVAPEPLAGVDAAWSADHRPLGIFVAAGPRISQGRSDELNLMDVCPTSLALLAQPVPHGLDGKVATGVIRKDFLELNPVTEGAATSVRQTSAGYSEEEAAAVAEHLKDLGYIE